MKLNSGRFSWPKLYRNGVECYGIMLKDWKEKHYHDLYKFELLKNRVEISKSIPKENSLCPL